MREFVAGRLSGDARARAQQHLEQCSGCRMLAVELTREGDTDRLPSRRSASLDTAAAFASGSETCTTAPTTGEASEHAAALAACQSGGGDARKLVREAARDAHGLRAMRMRWTDALARILDAGVAIVMRDHARARNQLQRAHEELTAAGMMLCAMMMRRRLGEVTGGAEGRETIAATDAWLAARDVVSPERLARLYVPEIP